MAGGISSAKFNEPGEFLRKRGREQLRPFTRHYTSGMAINTRALGFPIETMARGSSTGENAMSLKFWADLIRGMPEWSKPLSQGREVEGGLGTQNSV